MTAEKGKRNKISIDLSLSFSRAPHFSTSTSPFERLRRARDPGIIRVKFPGEISVGTVGTFALSSNVI